MRSRKETTEFNWLSIIPVGVLFVSFYPSIEKGYDLFVQVIHTVEPINFALLF